MTTKFIPLVLLMITINFAQETAIVKFIVDTENIPDSSMVYITGNHSLLGSWEPDFRPLEFIENKWQLTLSIEKNFSMEFKFTLGSWQSEALKDDGSVPPNHKIKVLNDTTLIFKINLWANQIDIVDKKQISGQITGTVNYHKNFKGRNILPRDVVVWLPPDYELNKNFYYPVLYMHDGQNAFDPTTSSFGTDWQIDEAADTLIRKKYIQPIIIVGIYNTINRGSEYADNDTGYAYIKLIIDELKPFIDSSYRTLSDAENTAVMGTSLGGLVSFIMAWENPEVFSMTACLSTAFKIERYDYVSEVSNYNNIKKPLKFYIDNGGIGVEEKLQTGIDEMIMQLNSLGYKEGLDYYWFKDILAEHNESAWSKRIWRALIFFFGSSEAKKYLYIN